MTLIEGVGDEVTDFFIVLTVLVVGWLAWCSTSITDQPLIRTILILQDRTRTRITELRANYQNANARNRIQNLGISEEESTETASTDNNETETNCPEPSSTAASTNAAESDVPSEATPSEEVLIEAMDSFSNEETTLLQRTTKVDSPEKTIVQESTAAAAVNNTDQAIEELATTDVAEISIKLKFINDDQKVVTGSLKEMLGDFKRRHFQVELQAQKLVRLIFNGQVLQPDSQTLERCGLYNNCVVHCLVHQPRPTPVQSAQSSALDNSSSLYFNPQSFDEIPARAGISLVHNGWDLSRLPTSALVFLVGVAWYSRYHYAQLFTPTTTLALCLFTAIFVFSLFSNFFIDEDDIRNMEEAG